MADKNKEEAVKKIIRDKIQEKKEAGEDVDEEDAKQMMENMMDMEEVDSEDSIESKIDDLEEEKAEEEIGGSIGDEEDLSAEKRREYVRKLKAEGITQKAMARILGVSEATITRDMEEIRKDHRNFLMKYADHDEVMSEMGEHIDMYERFMREFLRAYYKLKRNTDSVEEKWSVKKSYLTEAMNTMEKKIDYMQSLGIMPDTRQTLNVIMDDMRGGEKPDAPKMNVSEDVPESIKEVMDDPQKSRKMRELMKMISDATKEQDQKVIDAGVGREENE